MNFLGPTEEQQIEEVAAGLHVSPGDVVRRMIEAAFSPEEDKRLFLDMLAIYRDLTQQPAGSSFSEALHYSPEISFPQTLRDYILNGATYGKYWSQIYRREAPKLFLAYSSKDANISPEMVARLLNQPDDAVKPFYETATPEEWTSAFVEWTESHRAMPQVPAYAFSREADYEDRF